MRNLAIENIHRLFCLAGISHKIIQTPQDVDDLTENDNIATSRAKPIIRNVPIKFKNATERKRIKLLRKKYERQHKNELKLKRKRYNMLRKHKKPNAILSNRMKKVAQKYKKR